MYFYLATANWKICFFFLVLDILYFARGTQKSSILILNILISWAVGYCGDVMFYYFLLAENSGSFNYSPLREIDNL